MYQVGSLLACLLSFMCTNAGLCFLLLVLESVRSSTYILLLRANNRVIEEGITLMQININSW